MNMKQELNELVSVANRGQELNNRVVDRLLYESIRKKCIERAQEGYHSCSFSYNQFVNENKVSYGFPDLKRLNCKTLEDRIVALFEGSGLEISTDYTAFYDHHNSERFANLDINIIW